MPQNLCQTSGYISSSLLCSAHVFLVVCPPLLASAEVLYPGRMAMCKGSWDTQGLRAPSCIAASLHWGQQHQPCLSPAGSHCCSAVCAGALTMPWLCAQPRPPCCGPRSRVGELRQNVGLSSLGVLVLDG